MLDKYILNPLKTSAKWVGEKFAVDGMQEAVRSIAKERNVRSFGKWLTNSEEIAAGHKALKGTQWEAINKNITKLTTEMGLKRKDKDAVKVIETELEKLRGQRKGLLETSGLGTAREKAFKRQATVYGGAGLIGYGAYKRTFGD